MICACASQFSRRESQMRRRCEQVFDVCTYLPLNGTSPFRSSDAAPLRRTNARTLRRHRFEIHCNFRQIQSMLSIAVERAAGVGAFARNAAEQPAWSRTAQTSELCIRLLRLCGCPRGKRSARSTSIAPPSEVTPPERLIHPPGHAPGSPL